MKQQKVEGQWTDNKAHHLTFMTFTKASFTGMFDVKIMYKNRLQFSNLVSGK